VSEVSSAIVPPIVVAEGWDATFHRTERDVLAYYEPWFPGDAQYRAFDSQGRRLELVAVPPVKRRHIPGRAWADNAHRSALRVRVCETEPHGAGELADLLRGWLGRVDALHQATTTESLPDLLAAAVDRAGFTP
jgi:hypothetical protein